MNGLNDDVRLPFSVLDPIVGNVYSVRWEPEMIRGNSALKISTGDVLLQIGMTVLKSNYYDGFNVCFAVRKCLLLIYHRVFIIYFHQS